nr:hypothetical protein [Tanacetum cinerariifolium]
MAQPTPRNYVTKGHHTQYVPLSHAKPQKHRVPPAVLTQSKSVSNTVVRPVSAALPNISVTRPRHANQIVLVVSAAQGKQGTWGNPQLALQDKKVIDSGCSRHMTRNISYLSDFKELNGGYVAFGGNPKGGKITGKGKIKTGKLDFDNGYFVKELKFNLFSVSQMCDKKNSVLFTDTKCLVLSFDFKLPDESQVLLRVPKENNMYNVILLEDYLQRFLKMIIPMLLVRKLPDESQVLLRVPKENNMYNVNLKNIVPSRDLTCLFAKATLDESNLWHRRLAHVNFKTFNKLMTGNLVRGLPTKVFENDNSYVACKKGKQHRASCKTKPVGSVDQPLFRLHMDLFGPTFVKSLNKKNYFLVITDYYSRFTRVFFLATKDETCPILKTLITGLENQLSLTVKNGITEKKNKTLIEAARTTLADLLHLIPFWAKASFKGRLMNDFLLDTLCVVKNLRGCCFDGKEHDFDVKKPESKVILSPSSSAQSKKQDDKIMKEAKGKSLVESITGYRDINAKFQDCSKNSSNEVPTASTTVPTVGQNSFNSANTFNAAGLSNTAVSPTYGDASQFPDDPDIPGLENIIYSDDEDIVGAEAEFNNLESSIPVSPIPTTRIHKDHLVSQIIGDLSSTTQIRSMTRAVKDQGGLSQMFGNNFHTCMFACFLSQEEPNRVKQKEDDIFISQDKYVGEVLRKFGLTKGKSASTPIDIKKPLLKDPDGEDVYVHIYRSMIGSLMYLTSSIPDIMFTDSPFDLVAYSDSDYARASLDRKSTTSGCQFLRCRLISWQCKKQTVVATSSTEAKYVATASCCT